MSWWTSGSRLEVFFNRDERNTRGAEIGPRIDVVGGVAFLAPRDSDQGGTWVGANERGLVAGILNGYLGGDIELAAAMSRGGIVVDCLAANDPESAIARLRGRDLARFRSFVLALLAPDRDPLVARWDRRDLVVERGAAIRPPLISSSVAGVEVDAKRRSVFEALTRPITPEALVAAHRSHEHGPSAFSVCMHRDDGATRSFTRLTIDPETVRVAWSGQSPCRGAEPVVVELPRARA